MRAMSNMLGVTVTFMCVAERMCAMHVSKTSAF
jgi:hypothetical protein